MRGPLAVFLFGFGAAKECAQQEAHCAHGNPGQVIGAQGQPIIEICKLHIVDIQQRIVGIQHINESHHSGGDHSKSGAA